MKKYLFLIYISILSCNKTFQLEEGDLLFQDLDSSPLCDAIELVTEGYNGANLSHLGLIVSVNGKLKVIEAIPPKVILTEINEFIDRSFDSEGNQKVIVGRLKSQYKGAIPNAINFAKKKLDVEYDVSFQINNGTYYCSELIYEAFNKNKIFELYPMSFKHPETEKTLQTWKEYYSDLNIEIPQDELGINPGIMSLSDKIEIIHFYGIPDGMKN